MPLGVVGLFTGFGGCGGGGAGAGAGAGLATACTMRALVACWLIWFSCSVLSLSNLSLESSAGVGILSLLGLGSVTFWLACSSAVDLRWFTFAAAISRFFIAFLIASNIDAQRNFLLPLCTDSGPTPNGEILRLVVS